jgi:LDH2 family malate/lactate/ureidoglycolate dehydrogenase
MHAEVALAYRHAGMLDEAICEYEKALALRPGFAEIVVPGEISWRRMEERDEKGIPIPPGLLNTVRKLGETAGVSFPA